MKVDIYKTIRRSIFVAVQAGMTAPSHVNATELFKSVELTARAPLIGLDPDEVMAAITATGWALIGARAQSGPAG